MDQRPAELVLNGSAFDNRRDSVDMSPNGNGLSPTGDGFLFPKIKKKKKLQRVRKRTNKLLHTHVALLLVCILSSLDSACVIGQIICDILIMSDSLYENEKLHTVATDTLFKLLPDYLNKSEHSDWNFEAVIGHLEEIVSHGNKSDLHGNEHQHTEDHLSHSGTHSSVSVSETDKKKAVYRRSIHHRTKRAAGASDDSHAHHESHTLLEELTHIFHIGSMAILSFLVLEIFFKIFAMWKHFLNHKLEVFDAFVVIVSWCLDVAFWEGIWARPGQEGATILIFILPWRVVRIVNSFVLVIQEKDQVVLKVIKQRLRRALRREKDSSAKLDRYRLEVRQLQGLCRKHGAEEGAIQACNPSGNKRRRSSLFSSLSSLASVAFASAVGHQPEPDRVSSSSSSDDEEETISNKRASWLDSTTTDTSTPVTFTLSPEAEETPHTSGVDNEVFRYDDETVSKLQNSHNDEALKTRL